MTFAQPLLAVVILAVPLLWIAARHGARKRAAAAQHFRSATTSPGGPGRANILLARFGFFALAVLALMQPQWGMRAEDAPRTGRDIVVVLDVSMSMLAEDAEPNRLEAARQQVRQLAEAVSAVGGHRLALITFSGRATLVSPLTLDYGLFTERLDQVGIGMISTEGSAIGTALQFAIDKIRAAEPAYVDLIVVTDGEDHGGATRAVARAAAAKGATVYTRAVGTPGDGAMIPLRTAEDGAGVIEFDGFPVRSRVGETLLREVAGSGGGLYLGAGKDPGALAALFRDVIADKPQRDLDQVSAEVPAHRFQWFVLGAILLLLLDVRGLTLFERRPA